MRRRHIACTIVGLIGLVGAGFYVETRALTLTYVSDLIESSQPNVSTNHTISFVNASAVPATGKIVISNESTGVIFPSGLDYRDVDLLVDSGSGYVQRSLAAAPSPTDDGVSVVTGSSGSLTITLNSSTGIGSSDAVQVLIGTHATSSFVGDTSLANPSATGSYRILINTMTASDVPIDSGTAMIAILNPVTVTAVAEVSAPVRYNGLPTGDVAAGNEVIEISLQTTEAASCRYATTTDVVYGSMTNFFSTSNTTIHSRTLSGFVDGQSYDYYVRCIDGGGEENTDDYGISFTMKESASSTTSVNSGSSAGGQGGIGSVPNGSNVLFLASVVMSGHTLPRSQVSFVKDGKSSGTVQSRDDGSFTTTISNLERGTYTLLAYVTDQEGRKSAGVSSVLTVGSGTNNVLASLLIPPTISLSRDSVGLLDSVEVSGRALPASAIEIFVTRQISKGQLGQTKKFTALATPASDVSLGGDWKNVISAAGLSRGTYQIKARMTTPGSQESGYSSTVFLGVGESASPDLSSRSDVNGDGKINLVDFSIMLSSWGTANPAVDFNEDGVVNLADFSILLFNWTG